MYMSRKSTIANEAPNPSSSGLLIDNILFVVFLRDKNEYVFQYLLSVSLLAKNPSVLRLACPQQSKSTLQPICTLLKKYVIESLQMTIDY